MQFKTLLLTALLVTSVAIGKLSSDEVYDHKIESLLESYTADEKDFLKPILENWRDEKKSFYVNGSNESIKNSLDELVQSERKIASNFKSKNQKSKAPSIPYNEAGYGFNQHLNTRHLGLEDFSDGYVYLVRIETPDGFSLGHNFGNSIFGLGIENSLIEKIKNDRNNIYDLFSEHLPAGTVFRVQDVYQRDNDYLFVRLESAFNGIDPEQIFTLPIVDRVYQFSRVKPHQRNGGYYDSVNGKSVRVKHLQESWNKESTYQVLREKLSNPYKSSAWIQIELSPTGQDDWENTRNRMLTIIEQSSEYGKHPLTQFDLPSTPLDGNPLIRESTNATLELLEILYASQEVINIVPRG